MLVPDTPHGPARAHLHHPAGESRGAPVSGDRAGGAVDFLRAESKSAVRGGSDPSPPSPPGELGG